MMTQSSTTFILPILRRGHSGGNVKYLQDILNSYGNSLQIDGVFDPETEAAVKQFQKSWGLNPDGIVGSKTWNALHAE
jgi:peptidoglycan hydrolase-like protein with peptidoglycan-binding domain